MTVAGALSVTPVHTYTPTGPTMPQLLFFFSLALTVCELRALFYVSPQFVIWFVCFPVRIHYISKEASMEAKLILCF